MSHPAPRLIRMLSCLAAVLLLAPHLAGLAPLRAAQTQIPAEEYQALEALYYTNVGSEWTNPWALPTDTPCSLSGVVCMAGHVTQLNLTYRGLQGPLSDTIGNLTQLTSLSLVGNSLSGPIPAALGNLTKLQTLQLDGNDFSSIPMELAGLTGLRTLQLSRNALTGEIPPGSAISRS